MRRLLVFTTVGLLWSCSANAQDLTRDYCRNKADENDMVRCIEQGEYDPCDDSSGSGSGWWTAQCAWAHLKIAEKKMAAAEQAIIGRLRKTSSQPQIAIAEFKLTQERWREFRDVYCRFANTVRDLEGLEGEVLGYCIRRVTELRAKELEGLLSREQ